MENKNYKENTEPKLKIASCYRCNKSTYISNKMKVGVTLYTYDGVYYCLNHHPSRKQPAREHHGFEFTKAIDRMRKLSFNRNGKKKLRSRERKTLV